MIKRLSDARPRAIAEQIDILIHSYNRSAEFSLPSIML